MKCDKFSREMCVSSSEHVQNSVILSDFYFKHSSNIGNTSPLNSPATELTERYAQKEGDYRDEWFERLRDDTLAHFGLLRRAVDFLCRGSRASKAARAYGDRFEA